MCSTRTHTTSEQETDQRRSLFRRDRAAADELGLDDEPLRRMADEVERIAGDERHRLTLGGIEHVHVVGADDERLADAVAIRSIGGRDRERIADLDIAQRTKHGIAMAGDADVSRLP